MQDLVTVFGGSGFIGTQIVRALAKQGLRIRVAVRQPHLAHTMRLMGDVGQVEVVQANIRDEASVRRALRGAQACVNAVGIHHETGRQKFKGVHVEGAGAIARIARELDVARLVLISGIGVEAGGEAEAYVGSKAEAERVTREAFPTATILRPSVVFGQGDSILNRFAQMAVFSPVLPLIGGETRLQPVFVGDVGRAAARAVQEPDAAGRTYELGGPGVYTMREIVEFVLSQTGRRRTLVPLPFPVARFVARLFAPIGLLTPLAPPITPGQVDLLAADNVANPALPGLADLGVAAPVALEAVAPTYLYRFRKGGQFADQTMVTI